MGIEWQILGGAGADNALFATIDSGQARESFLFDCGEGCLSDLRPSSVQSVSHVFFSHFHMDHVSGFDSFFRLNYNRPAGSVHVWGPPGAIELMWHRFRGFSWNLHTNQPGEWVVTEISPDKVSSARFYTREAFGTIHTMPDQPNHHPVLYRSANWHLEARLLPHGSIPSTAYRLVEASRTNINPVAMKRLGLLPGPWLKDLTTSDIPDSAAPEIDGSSMNYGELRKSLLVSTPGESIAYLTDFRITAGTAAWDDLISWLSGTNTLVCESQYRNSDERLAIEHGHLTADLAGRIASESGAGHLILQHLSKRYHPEDWIAMREEARFSFPRASFPPGWAL